MIPKVIIRGSVGYIAIDGSDASDAESPNETEVASFEFIPLLHA